MVSAPGRRQQVAYAKKRGLSKRRACALLDVARSGLDHESIRDRQDAPVIARMRELAAQYPRYGYRRIRIFMERDGFKMSIDRAHRLWKKAQLQVPKKRRRRIATGRPRPTAPTAKNHVWAIDFVFDTCADGRQLKCLTVVDEWTRESLAIDVAGSIRARRVVDVLSRLVSVHGAPAYVRSDNGPEFVSKALLKWIVDENIGSVLSDSYISPTTTITSPHLEA
jgi:putative transposase